MYHILLLNSKMTDERIDEMYKITVPEDMAKKYKLKKIMEKMKGIIWEYSSMVTEDMDIYMPDKIVDGVKVSGNEEEETVVCERISMRQQVNKKVNISDLVGELCRYAT